MVIIKFLPPKNTRDAINIHSNLEANTIAFLIYSYIADYSRAGLNFINTLGRVWTSEWHIATI